MTLLHLDLTDVGPFVGYHRLELCSSPAKEGSVTLVGGRNGTGKSTLMAAIQLALFGDAVPRSRQLQGRLLRRGSTRAVVALAFRWEGQDGLREVVLRRAWGPDSAMESRVEVDGQQNAEWEAEWPDRLEAAFPVALLPLFAFDGETVRAIATQERLPPTLGRAAEVLLGLDLPRQAVRELRQAADRLRRAEGEASPDGERSRHASRAESDVQEAFRALAAAETRMRAARASWEELDTRLLAQGGDHARRRQLEMDLGGARERLEAATHELELVAGGLAPLLITRELVTLSFDLFAAGASPLSPAGADWVIARDRDVADRLTAEGAPREWVDRLRALTSDLPPPAPDTDAEALKVLRDVPSWLGAARSRLDSALAAYHAARDVVADLTRRVARQPDEADVVTLVNARRVAREALDAAVLEHATVEIQLAAAESRRDHARMLLGAADAHRADLARKATEAVRGAAAADRTVALLTQYGDALSEQRTRKLEAAVLAGFNALQAKAYLRAVHIDTVRWSLSVDGPDGTTLPLASLSAGEQQMLAFALLDALQVTAGRPLPILIDTPLARLDTVARDAVLGEWLVRRRSQVVVFATDAEISPHALARLQARGLLNGVCTVVAVPGEARSELRPGYFGEQD